MNQSDRVDPTFGSTPPGVPVVDFPQRLPRTRHALEFNGRAGEYFGIWIVNVLLSVVTLGIYSAWAKVRTHRYFYANTTLAGSSFEYLANPIQILKGRLIAYAFVITLGVAFKLQVFWLVVPMYLLVIALFPLIIWMGMRFRARYSAWRGLRFQFNGSKLSAYGAFMGMPFLSVFTLYLLVPRVVQNQQEYMVTAHRFGGARFRFSGPGWDYYRPFLAAIGSFFLLVILATVATGVVASTQGPADPEAAPVTQEAAARLGMFAVAGVYAVMFPLAIYVRTRWTNLLWNNTSLGEHRFESTASPSMMIWLYFSNAVAILCTVGLAVPWAKVRLMRYRADNFAMSAYGTLDDFVGRATARQSAVGAELSDALDLDLDMAL